MSWAICTSRAYWTWGALGEVTVNIYSLAVERKLGITPSRLKRDNAWPKWTRISRKATQSGTSTATAQTYGCAFACSTSCGWPTATHSTHKLQQGRTAGKTFPVRRCGRNELVHAEGLRNIRQRPCFLFLQMGPAGGRSVYTAHSRAAAACACHRAVNFAGKLKIELPIFAFL